MKDEYEKIIAKIEAVKYPNQHEIEKKANEDMEASFVGTVAELKAAKEKVKKDCDIAFNEQVDDYHSTIVHLEEELINAVHRDIGFSDEIFNIMWNLAYQRSHAYGYNEVIIEVEDMYDSVKTIVDLATAEAIAKMSM